MTAPAEMVTMIRTVSLADFEIERADDGGDGRMLTGQAVPYGVTIDVPSEGIRERWARGANSVQLPHLHRVQLTYRHQSHGGEVVGRLHSGEEMATGLRVRSRVSNTSLGNDVLELVRDRAVSEMSVGFRAKPAWGRKVDGVTEWQRAHLFEVALVPEGAYGRNATVTGVRSMGEMLRSADYELDGELAPDDVDELLDEGSSGLDVVAARALVDGIPMLSAGAVELR